MNAIGRKVARRSASADRLLVLACGITGPLKRTLVCEDESLLNAIPSAVTSSSFSVTWWGMLRKSSAICPLRRSTVSSSLRKHRRMSRLGIAGRERAAQMLAQPLVQRRQQHAAGVVAVHRLEQDQVDFALLVLGGVGAHRLAARTRFSMAASCRSSRVDASSSRTAPRGCRRSSGRCRSRRRRTGPRPAARSPSSRSADSVPRRRRIIGRMRSRSSSNEPVRSGLPSGRPEQLDHPPLDVVPRSSGWSTAIR